MKRPGARAPELQAWHLCYLTHFLLLPVESKNLRDGTKKGTLLLTVWIEVEDSA